MEELIKFIKSKCSQEEIGELVKELSTKEEPKKNDVPRTWEEYCSTIKKGYYIDTHSNIYNAIYNQGEADFDMARNVLPTKEMAEAFLAMMQLMSLRQAWIKDWKPEWNDETTYKFRSCHKVFSFPTEEMAEDFLKCFKDLIEKAKILI